MRTYTFVEKLNANSYREGVSVLAQNLSAAKRKASRQQMFRGTVLEISDAVGILATKKKREVVGFIFYVKL